MESDALPVQSPDKWPGTSAVKVLQRKPLSADNASAGLPSAVDGDADNSSNADISGSAAGNGGTGTASLAVDQRGGLLRSSIDRGIEKLKDRSRSTSTDPKTRRDSQDSSASGRKLSKLVPVVSRRRRKTKASPTGKNPDSLALDRSTTDGSLTTTATTSAAAEPLTKHSSSNNSSDSLAQGKSVASSILTEDSDPGLSTRPSLATRPSHTGYLTLTSPLIATETVEPPNEISSKQQQQQQQTSAVDQPTNADFKVNAPQRQTEILQPDRVVTPPPTNTGVDAAKNPSFLRKLNVTPSALRSDTGNTIETPSTLVTPPTPDQPQHPFSPIGPPSNNRSESPPPTALHSFTHRRVKSASAGPSRLAVNAPLTPALEEVKTPGGSLVQPNSQPASTSFFSSVFSATQSAVSSISNTFSNTSGSGQKPRQPESEKTSTVGDEEVIVTNAESSKSGASDDAFPPEPAVVTLGSGSLSLSHLGISESNIDGSMQLKEDSQDDSVPAAPLPRDHSGSLDRKETVVVSGAGADAQSADKPPVEKAASIAADQGSLINRPKSASSAVNSLPGDATPPRSIINGVDDPSTHRSGSVRSRISDHRKKHRKNSSYSNSGPSAIASALVASHSALVNPATTKTQRLTTYPTANNKRNKDFHQLFRSVPEDDPLIEDYSAALQREILLHGRLYVSERHICFSSNIMGWVTNLVVSFDEVVALEKKNTAMIFPNAIVIQTLHAKNTFASLINREGTYEMLLGIWKSQHPNLKATETGHALDNSTTDLKNGVEDEGSDDDSDEDDDFEEDEMDEMGAGSLVEGTSSIAGSDIGEPARPSGQRISSQAVATGFAPNGTAKASMQAAEPTTTSAQDAFPGPATHPPTECSDQDTHYDKPCLDDTLPAPLGKVYSMLFGPLSGSVMKKFLEEQESTEIQYDDDKKGLGENTKTYSYSFIKKLGGGIGPKQTKCIVNQTLDAFDLEKAVSVTCSTQTPDVPSGNAFVTKTRYCLTWGPNNTTRLLMNSTTEWSGKSFLRSAIDKGAETGQQQYGKDLSAFLRSQLASKSPAKGSRGKLKGRRKKQSGSAESPSREKPESKPSAAKSSDGLLAYLGPLRGVLEPVGDTLGPFGSLVVVGLSCLLVVLFWFRQPQYSSHQPLSDYRLLTPQRLAAYEELWRREESELWSWLEDRVQIDNLGPAVQQGVASVKQSIQERNLQARLGDSQMNDRQLKDAIRTTEERLIALKAAVDRKKIT